jgi:hypothetical protein
LIYPVIGDRLQGGRSGDNRQLGGSDRNPVNFVRL